MTILLLLIPISLALLGVAIWAFVWAVRRGQFDELDSAALDILVDDQVPPDGLAPNLSAAPARHDAVADAPTPSANARDNHAG